MSTVLLRTLPVTLVFGLGWWNYLPENQMSEILDQIVVKNSKGGNVVILLIMGLTYFRHSFLNTTSVNIEYKICGLIPQKLTVNSFLLHTHTHTHTHTFIPGPHLTHPSWNEVFVTISLNSFLDYYFERYVCIYHNICL